MSARLGRTELAWLASFSVLVCACNEDAVEVTQRSLQASSEVTFVCRGPDGTGLEQKSCPDYETGAATLFALVTQTATDEVALIDVAHANVIDVEPVVPGFSFLRVPSRPGDIVTTPGGAASFVGLGGVGKTGVVALPTTCLGPPRAGEPVHDVTTFPACRLPSRPGDMVVLVEPPGPAGIQVGCDPASALESSVPVANSGTLCPGADLTTEPGPVGRRKLVVSLPDSGELVVLDAQSLLELAPGAFEPCAIERTVPLAVTLDPADMSQITPPDLVPAPGCMISMPLEPTVPPGYTPVPAGLALGDGRLYVGDQGAPVVHVLDASSACGLTELPPLLPMSFEDPARVVTTTRVAVSPLTTKSKRFVYAIDEHDQPASSVMVFDVSEGVSNRTPLVRPGVPRVPFEPSDRLRFGAPVTDLTFALRDLPKEDMNHVAQEGVLCSPDPALNDTQAALYRPSSDLTQGARPKLLRGVFGLVMLTSGQVVIVNIDDFDAPCRRPVGANPSTSEDFRGCAGDPDSPPYYTIDGEATSSLTVTNEVSCNMVEPHRVRSQFFGITNPSLSVGAPSLRSLPHFSAPDVAIDVTEAERPKLLAVDLPPTEPGGEPVEPLAYVGTSLYQKGGSGLTLPTDPNDSEEFSLTLPFTEPRSHLASDSFALTYEGRVTGEGTGGFLTFDGANGGTLDDRSAFFCGQGVYDIPMMEDYGQNELGLDGKELASFAEGHADYVQVTDGFPALQDSYWLSERGQDCGGRPACYTAFGRSDAKDLDRSRELAVLKAYQDHLVVQPRKDSAEVLETVAAECTRCDADPMSPACLADGVAKDKVTLLWEHCFPGGVRYTVRASKQWVLTSGRPLHDVTASPVAGTDPPLYECVRDCNPKKHLLRSRAFEVSASVECEGDTACGVGPASPGEEVCAYDPTQGPPGDQGLTLDDPAARCVFDNLTSRFVVYRGLAPSVRGMAFTWQTAGGFSPLVASLTTQSIGVLPQHVAYLPELQSIAVVDGATLGLSLMSLDTLHLNADWPVF